MWFDVGELRAEPAPLSAAEKKRAKARGKARAEGKADAGGEDEATAVAAPQVAAAPQGEPPETPAKGKKLLEPFESSAKLAKSPQYDHKAAGVKAYLKSHRTALRDKVQASFAERSKGDAKAKLDFKALDCEMRKLARIEFSRLDRATRWEYVEGFTDVGPPKRGWDDSSGKFTVAAAEEPADVGAAQPEDGGDGGPEGAGQGGAVDA